jgi:two-component system, OmpR family, sensor histidine kinase MprB
MSFRRRLTFYCAGGIALVLVAGAAATYLTMRHQLLAQIDASLHADTVGVHFVQGSVDQVGPANAKVKSMQAQGIKIAAPGGGLGTMPAYVQLVDAGGQTAVAGVDGVKLPVTARMLRTARTTGAFYTDLRLSGAHLRMRVVPVKGNLVLLVARSLTEVDRTMTRLAWSLGLTAAVGTALAALVAVIVARRALHPVRRLGETAERVASTRDLSERIDVEGTDELGRLAAAFNGMLDSLETAVASQRRLVSDASHELRTPLTSLRTNIDVLREGIELDPGDRRKLLRDVTAEIEELTTLVGNLVDLARGSQRDLHLRQVRLDEIAAAVVERARARFPRLTFELRAHATTVWGDVDDLDSATWNLVENAAKWSASGATIEVEAAAGEIVVRDHGPGVAPEDRPFVFDRFYRSAQARGTGGSGLGLAIVRQVAETHGGSVDVADAAGGGASFRLSLIEAA